MDSLSTIFIIASVLVIAVMGMTYVQRKEEAKAKIRQQITQYRYRANEAVQILDNFSKVPIGLESRTLLLQYAQLNLVAALKLSPSETTISNNLASVKLELKKPSSAIDSQMLQIPDDINQLTLLLKNLSKLGKYLQKFQSITSMNTNSIPIAVNKLNSLIAESKITAFAKQAKKALANGDYVNAQRNLQTAKNMLKQIPQKNSRLIKLAEELDKQTNSTAEEVASNHKDVSEKADVPARETNQDEIFGPKKKW